MPNVALITELEAPPKGKLRRVKVSVMTPPNPGQGTVARVILSERSFDNNAGGYSAIKANTQYIIWDSNITGTLDIDITTPGAKIDRIFEDGGLDYENRDEDGTGEVAGWTPHIDHKNAKIYVYIELDGMTSPLNLRVDIKTNEKA